MFAPKDLRTRLQRALGDAYRLRDKIGEGGMGVVYSAWDVQLDRTVAIKTIREEFLKTQKVRLRFQQEMRAMARLRHPNIMPVYTVGEGRGLAYMVMPHLQGHTLRTELGRGKPLAIPRATGIAIDVARGLAAVHEPGFVHRDVKPENIILEGRDEHVVLMDFGIVKAVEESQVTKEHWYYRSSGRTVSGTAEYMSPEHARAEPAIDHRSDLYSLGIVTYELLTGEQPITGRDGLSVMRKQKGYIPPPPQLLNSDIPSDLGAVVMRCLEKNPADRWVSAEALIDALTPWAQP